MQERVVEQDGKHLFSSDGCANRHHAAAEGFCQTQDVRLYVLMLAGEHLARAPHTGLHFIEDHQCVELIAQLTHGGEIARRRQNDATFTLNRLKDHCSNIITGFFALAKGRAHGFDIAKRYMTKPWQQWHKRFAEGRFRRGRQRAK